MKVDRFHNYRPGQLATHSAIRRLRYRWIFSPNSKQRWKLRQWAIHLAIRRPITVRYSG